MAQVSVRQRWFPWLVALVTFAILLASAAFRASVSVMVVPFEDEFGWSRSQTSLAVSLNLVVYGLTAPFAAALMERFGIRRVAAAALGLFAVSALLTTVMTSAWQLVLLWGVGIGLAAGATALVFGSLVVGRWFVTHRGLVLGILGTAWAMGQLVFLPLIASTVDHSGWRSASVAIAVGCLVLVPLTVLVLRDRPADVGLRPYGATGELAAGESATNATGSGWAAAGNALATLRWAARTRVFWLLAGTFFVCGWTTNGIISTHFVPAAHDHGMGATTAAGLLAVVGIFDIIGTVGSGWLSDRADPRILLAIYYGLRGIALLAVPALLGPNPNPPLLVVMVLFGLDWVATVPPTVVLCQRAFGPERGAVVFGWVFASHMIGGAAAAMASGAIRDAMGDYATAWFLAGALALLAALASLAIPNLRRTADAPAIPVH